MKHFPLIASFESSHSLKWKNQLANKENYIHNFNFSSPFFLFCSLSSGHCEDCARHWSRLHLFYCIMKWWWWTETIHPKVIVNIVMADAMVIDIFRTFFGPLKNHVVYLIISFTHFKNRILDFEFFYSLWMKNWSKFNNNRVRLKYGKCRHFHYFIRLNVMIHI